MACIESEGSFRMDRGMTVRNGGPGSGEAPLALAGNREGDWAAVCYRPRQPAVRFARVGPAITKR
jgi:hypothetical protein